MPWTKQRREIASSGLDDFLAGLGGHNTGLRIPAQAVGAVSGLPLTYLFLLHVVDLVPGDVLVGLAQLLTVATPQTTAASTAVYPFEREIVSPLWRPPDGFARWFLTAENNPGSGRSTGAFDSDSFIFEDAQAPALLYETVHFPVVPPAPGYLGLDDYTAPALQGSVVLEARDLRWPWSDLQSFPSMRRAVSTNTRFRFYVAVRQTSAATRPKLPIAANAWADFPGVFAPEDGLLVASQQAGSMGAPLAVDSLQYWRCAGRIVHQSGKFVRSFEEGEAAAVAPPRGGC